MVTADLRESGCDGGRAAILVQYESIFIEIALLNTVPVPESFYSTVRCVSRLPPVSFYRPALFSTSVVGSLPPSISSPINGLCNSRLCRPCPRP